MLFMEHGADGLSAEQQERAYERQLSNTAATMAATSGGGGSPTHRPVIVDSDDDDDDEPNAMDDDDAAAVQRALAEDDHDVGGYRAPIAPRRDVLIGGADDDYGAGPFYGNGGRGGNAHADAMLEMFGGVQTAGPVRMRDPFQLAPEEEGG